MYEICISYPIQGYALSWPATRRSLLRIRRSYNVLKPWLILPSAWPRSWVGTIFIFNISRYSYVAFLPHTFIWEETISSSLIHRDVQYSEFAWTLLPVGIVVELLSIFIDKIAADSPLFFLLGFNHERYYKFFLLSSHITLIIADYVVAL